MSGCRSQNGLRLGGDSTNQSSWLVGDLSSTQVEFTLIWQDRSGRLWAFLHELRYYMRTMHQIGWQGHPSPQWWSDCSTTAHIVLDLRSLIWGFGESWTTVHCISHQPIYPKMCSTDILQLVCRNSKGGLFGPVVWGLRERSRSGISQFDSPSMGFNWLPIDTYYLSLTVFWVV